MSKLEDMRHNLHLEITDNNNELINDKVLEQSQKLDKLVVKEQRTRLNRIRRYKND
ncbi:Spo0E family sporulation regulatory protein-aspartic acid phosphatase [Sporosalibacterium faouarense]|uniref:Spo0E family sporulation regulatory protein-aspartic acid phosphatase n=1 Tax=Sporosalibacterium faouarense TaxID=516123 RepID=UPI00192B5B91|nr:Spo0E family sporulation regulatory protein-aspartic acid phosphatase [Sporosalibacterium faouarense]